MKEPGGLDRVEAYLSQWKRERPDLDHEPMGVIARLTRTGVFLANSIRDNLRGAGIEPWEFDVLATLRCVGPPHTLSPKDLGATTMVGGATLTHRMDRMVDRGMVSRKVDPDNRRRLQITLTPAGKELIDSVIAGHIDNAGRFLDALTDSECKILSGLLRKILLSHGDTHSQSGRRPTGRQGLPQNQDKPGGRGGGGAGTGITIEPERILECRPPVGDPPGR
jgi:DNA-binding MarR family transcriptional regulator